MHAPYRQFSHKPSVSLTGVFGALLPDIVDICNAGTKWGSLIHKTAYSYIGQVRRPVEKAGTVGFSA